MSMALSHGVLTMTDRNISSLKHEIASRLRPLGLERVVLFGSVARGEDNADSDIDLYVVTRDENIPENWSEKNRIYLSVSRHLRDLRKQYPIDLIVHTKAMYDQFVLRKSFMSDEILKYGVTIV